MELAAAAGARISVPEGDSSHLAWPMRCMETLVATLPFSEHAVVIRHEVIVDSHERLRKHRDALLDAVF